MSRKLGISMRQRGDLMRQLTEGVADGRGEIRVIVVGGEKRLKFVDVPTEVTEDLPRVRREIEATIDRQSWPVMGKIGRVQYDMERGAVTHWELNDRRG